MARPLRIEYPGAVYLTRLGYEANDLVEALEILKDSQGSSRSVFEVSNTRQLLNERIKRIKRDIFILP